LTYHQSSQKGQVVALLGTLNLVSLNEHVPNSAKILRILNAKKLVASLQKTVLKSSNFSLSNGVNYMIEILDNLIQIYSACFSHPTD
jgi:hypothetical protein